MGSAEGLTAAVGPGDGLSRSGTSTGSSIA
jgi:hypothetical protein